jgi:hypothetical protein
MDEYPLHQVPLSLRHPASSDRNFYDRCYFNAHDRTGDVFLVTGLGVYPNLGVVDAYATVRHGDRQVTLRLSDALGDDRSVQAVGPYRVEVVEPLHRIRLVCDGNEHGVAFDLTWEGSFPAVEEQHHVLRQGPAGRAILDACRFAQVGTWTGTLEVDGHRWSVDPAVWVGTRDRSWGIRPVGEPDPAGRAAAEADPGWGFWWTYVPLRFDDFAIVVIAQEDGDGTRTLNDAVRVWPAAAGRPPEQLGWPTIDITYRDGTRLPTGAVVRAQQRDGTPVVIDVEPLGAVALAFGSGYGGDSTWSHGQWRGRGFAERVEVDYADPAVAALLELSIVDHVARATCDGREGWGMFEHLSIGRHPDAPSPLRLAN